MNITKFVNLKVCAVAAFSCAATVGVQHWRTSESLDNVPPPMREEQTQLKQLKLETEKVLDDLRVRQAKVEKDEKAFAEKQSALDEKIAAFEQMRTSGATTVVAKEPDGVVAIEPIGKDPKPAIVKVIHSDPVVPPTDYVPRRPQVFDGGNREPVVPKGLVTDETRLLYFHDPSFAMDGYRCDPAIPRRGDALQHPVNIFKRRRYTNLKPQHVASFRATRTDGRWERRMG